MTKQMTDQEIKELIVNNTEVDTRNLSDIRYLSFNEIQRVTSDLMTSFKVGKTEKKAQEEILDKLKKIRDKPENTAEEKQKIEGFIYNIDFDLQLAYKTAQQLRKAKQDIDKREAELKKREAKLKREERIEKRVKDKYTKVNIHTVNQMFSDNKQLTMFSDAKVDEFRTNTGLNLTNRPKEYGVVLNQSQNKVFEGILKAFTKTDYKGHKEKDRPTALKEIYSNTETSGKTLIKADNAPYKNIDKLPTLNLTQADIIDLSGYDGEKQSDKQHVINAISFLATKQFCFYWIRLKTENGKPVKDKSGDYIKEEVMEVGTLLRIKVIRDQKGVFKYYEIDPSAPMLDQLNTYFLLVPINWRDEVKQLTGKTGSSYTYNFLLWLRLQYEHIRRYNKNGGKNRKAKPFKVSKSWDEIAIALKMPPSMYKRNKPRSRKIIHEAYDVAIKLGYLKKVEDNGATDILYLDESYYPKPGELK